MAREIATNSTTVLTASDLTSILRNLNPSELSQVLFPDGFCSECQSLLKSRILNLTNHRTNGLTTNHTEEFWGASPASTCTPQHTHNDGSSWRNRVLGNSSAGRTSNGTPSQQPNSTPSPVINLQKGLDYSNPGISSPYINSASKPSTTPNSANGLSEEEQMELTRISEVGRKKDFVHFERVDGKKVNVMQGLELHTGVFSTEEQKQIVNCVYQLQEMGRNGKLRERTYSEPRKWMRGKGRVTLQFGCCYNYAVDKHGNPPGIVRDEQVDPLPPTFKQMVRRLLRWQVLPPTCIPNSCIVNIYDEGDCIPPHIDHHDFVRPFCTVSFLSQCNILFGSGLKVAGPGEFSGPVSIPLPVGSVLVLKGNGADVAKHCVPAVPAKRISVTFRKMDDSKLPYRFSQDPELTNIKPLVSSKSSPPQAIPVVINSSSINHLSKKNTEKTSEKTSSPLKADDFPPLGSRADPRRVKG